MDPSTQISVKQEKLDDKLEIIDENITLNNQESTISFVNQNSIDSNYLTRPEYLDASNQNFLNMQNSNQMNQFNNLGQMQTSVNSMQMGINPMGMSLMDPNMMETNNTGTAQAEAAALAQFGNSISDIGVGGLKFESKSKIWS